MFKNWAIAIENPLKSETIGELITAISDLAVAIGLPIAIIFIVYSGFLFVSARGNEKKLETAKEGFKWAVIGAAIIVGAKFLAEAVVNFAEGL
ncbi:MAG: hypothetical protein AAB556_02005 [Patescibacteria group bacterium]